MKNKGMDLVWICVVDFEAALKFYTEVLGMTVCECNQQYKWAELRGEGGAMLGIGEACAKSPAGGPVQNAVMSFTVENLDEAVNSVVSKGAKLLGNIEECGGDVRMQLVLDPAGNLVHLVQKLSGQ